jgi:hypothetical protein
LVVDLEALFLVWRGDFVAAEEKTIRIAIDEVSGDLSYRQN